MPKIFSLLPLLNYRHYFKTINYDRPWRMIRSQSQIRFGYFQNRADCVYGEPFLRKRSLLIALDLPGQDDEIFLDLD
ncbi:MAG: hypothetical protein V7K48_09155 [Nostoc sp.]|uniref:hypothetical protein n=1 Tax=Nostoc sp. TaxID=1180 RepID=UPI002FF8AAF8